MFSKAVLVALASCALAMPQAPSDPAPAAATAPGPAPISISQCNTGQASCCQHTVIPTSGTASLLGLLGIVVQDLTLAVGLDCTSLSVVNVLGGPNCSQKPVCCEKNNFNGLINIGCTPISLG